MKVYNKGVKNKVMASHSMNTQSSRSHCIFSVTVEQVDPHYSNNSIISKMQFVDLAGSERQAYLNNNSAQH